MINMNKIIPSQPSTQMCVCYTVQDMINLLNVFFFLPFSEPRQGQPDFLWNLVEVLRFIQIKIYQNVLIC